VKDRIALERAVVAEKLAVRSFRLDVPARVERALEHPFRVRRHADVVGHALDNGQRRVAQRCDEAKLVHRQPHHRGDVIDGMRADHEAHRQRLAGARARLVDRAQIAGRNQIDAGFAAPAQHQPADAHIGPAGLGIDDEVDARGNIGRAVGAVAKMDGKLCEIGVIAGEHHLLHRRLPARHLKNFRRVAQPTQHLGQKRIRLDAERAREPRAAAGDIGDELGAFRTERAKQHRLRVALEHSRHVGEVGRPVDGVEFLAEAFHEAAQPEAIELGRLLGRLRLLDDAHWLSLRAMHYSGAAGAGSPIINEETNGLYRRRGR
jgi:hypothetical protein